MLRRICVQFTILMLFVLALAAAPHAALAGGVCGGTYIVESGDTFAKIAATCGTTVSAITAANPGVGEPLKAGQALTVPGYAAANPTLIVSTYDGSTSSNNYNYTYNYDYNNASNANYAYNNYLYYTAIYTVQYGDTFSLIASRYGVSVYDLWLANPYIPNINVIYPGQPIHVPPAPVYNNYDYGYNYNYNYGYAAASSAGVATPLSYGSAPAGTAKGHVKLVNRANGDAYVSLQGTMRDGTKVINEYWADGTMDVNVPVGWYVYVAWVGGHKYTGSFQLGENGTTFITFFSNRVTLES